jgi:hypothetical protein
MLDAAKNTTPVAAIQGLVNDSVDFDINFVSAEYPVVNPSEQIEKPALFSHGRQGRLVSVSPGFGFVGRHAA